MHSCRYKYVQSHIQINAYYMYAYNNNNWLVGSLVSWLVGRLVGWSVGWLVGWSVGRLFGCSVGR